MRITPELFDQIIRELAEGSSIRKCLNKRAMGMYDFFSYIDLDPKNQIKYDQAQRIKSEMHAEEITDIADEDENPARARNRIDSRKWYSSKINPQKYGERLQIDVVKTIDVKAAISEGRARIASLYNSGEIGRPIRDLNNIELSQVIESIDVNESRSMGQAPVDQPQIESSGEEGRPENSDDDIFG